jgi:N-acetylmuramoyl-L-alanine amidase
MKNLLLKSLIVTVTSYIILSMYALFVGREYKEVAVETTPTLRKIVDSQSLICLAENIYHEARSEPYEGKKAVALVTLNRVQSEQFPNSVCDVVKERRGNICQFSWYCGKERNKILTANNKHYIESMDIAQYVLKNHERLRDLTHGALYYHADYVSLRKIGVKNLEQTAKIGRHIFYKPKDGDVYARKVEPTDKQREWRSVYLLAYGRN